MFRKKKCMLIALHTSQNMFSVFNSICCIIRILFCWRVCCALDALVVVSFIYLFLHQWKQTRSNSDDDAISNTKVNQSTFFCSFSRFSFLCLSPIGYFLLLVVVCRLLYVHTQYCHVLVSFFHFNDFLRSESHSLCLFFFGVLSPWIFLCTSR